LNVEAAVREENEKRSEQLARKNQEMEAVKQLRETQRGRPDPAARLRIPLKGFRKTC